METDGGNPNPNPNPKTESTPFVGPTGFFWDMHGSSPTADQVSGLCDSLAKRPARDVPRPVKFSYAYIPVEDQDAKNDLKLACKENRLDFCSLLPKDRHRAHSIITFAVFDFAIRNPPPATIVFISGDEVFAPLLSKLRGKAYNIMVIGSSEDASSAFRKAGLVLYDWGPASRGEGFFPSEEVTAIVAVSPIRRLLLLSERLPGPLSFLPRPWMLGLLLSVTFLARKR